MSPLGVRRSFRRVVRVFLVIIAMTSVAAVILASVAFAVLQNLDEYRDELAHRVGEMLGEEVNIGAANVFWQGSRPILRLEDLRIGDPQGKSVHFKASELRLDPVESLRRRTIAAAGVRILGATIEVARREGGDFELLGFGTKEETKPGGFDVQLVRRLLSRPARLTLADAQLVYHDYRRRSEPVRLKMDVGIHKSPSGQQFSGAIRLPGGSASYITGEGTFALPPEGSGWIADLRVRSDGMLSRDLHSLLPELKLPGDESIVRFDWRVRTTERRKLTVSGRFTMSDLRLTAGREPQSLRTLSARMDFNLTKQGWRAQLSDVEVEGASQKWTAERGSLAHQFAVDDIEARYSVTLSSGRIEDLLDTLHFLFPARTEIAQLRGLETTGTAEDLTAAWVDREGDNVPFDVTAKLVAVEWPTATGRWGASGVSGNLWLNQNGGRVRLLSESGISVWPNTLIAQPLEFKRGTGTIDIVVDDRRVELTSGGVELSGDTVALNISGSILNEGDKPLELNLDIKAGSAEVDEISTLLPSPALSEGLNNWLVSALSGGVVEGASLTLRGVKPTDTESRGAPGVKLVLNARDVDVTYAPGWPVAGAFEGQVLFDEGKFAIEGDVRRLGKMAASVVAEIPDVTARDPTLALRASLASTGARFLNALTTLPIVDEAAGKQVRDVDVSGNIKASLALKHAMVSNRQDLKATLTLEDNGVAALAGFPRLDGIRGKLVLSNSILSAKQLDVVVDGQPTSLSGEVDLANGPTGKVQLRTNAPHDFWVDLLNTVAGQKTEPPIWLEKLRGQGAWNAEIVLKKGQPPEFGLSSDLKGVAIDLPSPLTKSAGTKRRFRISKQLGETGALRVQYGDIVQGLYRPNSVRASDFDLSVRVGPGKPPKLREGRWVVRGSIDALDLAALALGTKDDGLPTNLSKLDIDVSVRQLALAGAQFKQVRVKARENASGVVQIDVNSPDVTGFIRLPHTVNSPLVLDLSTLNISAIADSSNPVEVNPKDFPPLAVSIDSLRYQNRSLGAVEFLANKTANGVRLDSLLLAGNGVEAQGGASWVVRGKGQHTALNLDINADSLNALLKLAGYPQDIVEGGASRIVYSGAWNEGPFALSFDKMVGNLSINTGKGNFRDVDTGTGAQIIGLFNLRVLPRLLTLDLGSLFQKGLDFESIVGTLQIESGQAYTNELTLDGPTARITFAGRTGISTRDYDQVATISPKLSDSLPIAGAAFGVVGAGVGGAIWLVEKVIGTNVVDNVATVQYSLTGSWDDPKFERVETDVDETAGEAETTDR